MSDAIIDPFHRRLYPIITKHINDAMVDLAGGSAETLEQYHGQVAYIAAMNAVLALCKEIEISMHGTVSSKDEGETE